MRTVSSPETGKNCDTRRTTFRDGKSPTRVPGPHDLVKAGHVRVLLQISPGPTMVSICYTSTLALDDQRYWPRPSPRQPRRGNTISPLLQEWPNAASDVKHHGMSDLIDASHWNRTSVWCITLSCFTPRRTTLPPSAGSFSVGSG